MALLHQTIPAKHIGSLLRDGHYFTPCRSFPDKMEFYYGYCLFNCAMFSEQDIEKCVEHARNNPEINQWVHSTCVSCWVSDLRDETAMWEVHGKQSAAIRISINANRLCQHVQAQGHRIAFGRVTYEGLTSLVRPQFLAHWGLTQAEDAIHHFFFHKRGCYQWEQEFRVILESSEAVCVPLVDDTIEWVMISPLGKLDPKLETSLRDRFGDRVRTSATS
jgi:hypothetical protein